jgi:hypothetical protein
MMTEVPDLLPSLEGRVEEQARLYFDELLPRLIDRHFRGGGYVFLHELMRMHDERRVREALAWPPPSSRARARARRVRELCPLVLVPAGDPLGRGSVALAQGTLLLGQFQKAVTFHTLGPVAYSHAESVQHVELYELAFLCLGLDEERLQDELLQTIFHEYIHYFESFLRVSEQPLAGRERAASLPPLTLEVARRRDRWQRAKRWLGLGTLAVVVLLSVFAALAMTGALPARRRPEVVAAAPARAEPPPEERERALVARVRAAAAVGLGRDLIERAVGTPAVIGSASYPQPAWLTRLRLEADGELPRCPSPAGLVAWLRPQREVFPVRIVGVVYPERAGPLAVCFATIAR